MMTEEKYVDNILDLAKESATFPNAEPCREVVYEDETIRLERLWRWSAAFGIKSDAETGLLRVSFKNKTGKKYALASVEGKLLCLPVFDCLEDFNEGLAFAGIYDETGGKLRHFFIDRNMKVVFPSPFQETEGFENGKARGYIELKGGKRFWFYIDRNGKPFLFDVENPKYLRFGKFHEGLCRVSAIMLDKNNLAYIQQYDSPLNDAQQEQEPGTWGFVNEAGEEVITPQYIFAGDFHNGVAVVCKGKWVYREDWPIYGGDEEKGYWSEEMKWGVIDKEGKEVIPFVYDYVIRCKGEEGEEDTFTVDYGDKKHTHWGVLDARGNWLAKSAERNIIANSTPTKEGLFCFFEEDYWPFPEEYTCGIYDSRRNTVLFEPSPRNVDSFRNAHIFKDGTILIVETDEKGCSVAKIVDRNGNEKFPSDYSWINTDTKPYMVERDKKGEHSSVIGFIDENGKVVLPCVYEVQELCDDVYYEQRRFVFVQNGRQGLMDFDGNVLISPIYTSLYDIDRPLATFQKQPEWEAPWGLITFDGREVLPDEFDKIRWCEDKRHIICLRNGVFEMYLLTEKSTMGNTVQRNE